MQALSGIDLLAWSNATALDFQTLFDAHPNMLDLTCDVRESQSVRDLVQHIFAVELRYAERLNDAPATPYEAIPKDSVPTLFQTHEQANAMFANLLDRDAYAWDEEIEFVTRSYPNGMLASRRTIFAHALLHSIRHFAQLATLLRQNGHAIDAPLDFLFLKARLPGS